MIKNFTEIDLIKEVYQENTKQEHQHITQLRLSDDHLETELDELNKLAFELDGFMMKMPSDARERLKNRLASLV